MRFFVFFIFLVFVFSCNNNIKLNDSGWFGDDDVFVLDKKQKPYVLRDVLIIPENKTLIISNGVKLIFKNNGEIINNGSLFVGEKNSNDSLFSFSLKKEFVDTSFFYNVEVVSKNEKTTAVFSGEGVFKTYNSLFKNTYFNFLNGEKIFFSESVFNDCFISTNNSVFSVFGSVFNKSIINIESSTVNFNNSIFHKMEKPVSIINKTNSIINNCLILNSNNGFSFNNSFNNNILNSVFYKNKNSVDIYKNNIGYFKFFNNVFIENEKCINSVDSSQVYFINNNFDKNTSVLNFKLNNKSTKSIISKNNIYSNNINNFKLKNIKISNSYCISNTDSLIGYYNIYDHPKYIDSNSFNYELDDSSPGIRSGINNLNLGVNIKDINIIKYLK